jgi:hypothetical protein
MGHIRNQSSISSGLQQERTRTTEKQSCGAQALIVDTYASELELDEHSKGTKEAGKQIWKIMKQNARNKMIQPKQATNSGHLSFCFWEGNPNTQFRLLNVFSILSE